MVVIHTIQTCIYNLISISYLYLHDIEQIYYKSKFVK